MNCVLYKKRGKLQLRCSKSQYVDWQKIVGRKVCWPRLEFSAHAYWERMQDEKLVNWITLNDSFNHIENDIF